MQCIPCAEARHRLHGGSDHGWRGEDTGPGQYASMKPGILRVGVNVWGGRFRNCQAW